MARLFLAAATAVLIAAVACSSVSPTSPSGTGATITGTVIASPSAANVAVAGTPLSAAVDGTGSFFLRGVPAGNVQLVFSGSGASSAVSLLNVADQELIEIDVAITGGTATVQREVRGSSGKVVLCHHTGNGSYHTIDVSVNAEPAHRGHGDAKPGEPVPADRTKVFSRDCRLISPVEIKKFTNGQDADVEPGPTVAVGAPVNWTYVVTNNSTLTLTSVTVTDDRGVVVTCPQMLPAPGASITCNASGVAVAGQYRNVGTVTATASGMSFTDSDASHYHGGPVSSVTIDKFTNGQDVTQAPGPVIPVGDPVTWTYVVTNRTALALSSLTVTDDRGVAVACPQMLPAPGASITCNASGVAVAGQYRNVGMVVATAGASKFTDSDESFYHGGPIVEEPKVTLCHRTGNGSYHSITVGASAEPAHRAHGDAKVGEPVPGSPGQVFTASCGLQPAGPTSSAG
ncbi:MAG TPA: hypothetical protein VFO58_22510 [Vicinamibacterales bacterium]|nr:hypothetical protein [Vicinamibacterales bacterium]